MARKKKIPSFKNKTYSELSSMAVEGMTVSTLKQYIREMAVRVGRNVNSSMKPVASSARNVVNQFGTYRRKGVTYMKLGFSGSRKSDLIEKAQRMRTFAKNYAKNYEYRKKKNDRYHKAYDTFTKNHGHMEYDEFDEFFRCMNEVGTLFKEEGSPIINMYYEFRVYGLKPKPFADLIKEVIKEYAGKGTHEDVIDEVYRRLQQMYY